MVKLTPRTNSSKREGNHHSRINATNRSIVHECHLKEAHSINQLTWDRANRPATIHITSMKPPNVPHILMGASNSSKTGWAAKISFEVLQSHLISASVRFTCRPGLAPRTLSSCSIILSTSIASDMMFHLIQASIVNDLLLLLCHRNQRHRRGSDINFNTDTDYRHKQKSQYNTTTKSGSQGKGKQRNPQKQRSLLYTDLVSKYSSERQHRTQLRRTVQNQPTTTKRHTFLSLHSLCAVLSLPIPKPQLHTHTHSTKTHCRTQAHTPVLPQREIRRAHFKTHTELFVGLNSNQRNRRPAGIRPYKLRDIMNLKILLNRDKVMR
jgi:hypothetical protein